MRKLLLFCLLLFIGVFCSACVNSLAVYELNEKATKLIAEGDIKGAIGRLESSIDLDPNIYESRYNLANAYITVNECDKALEHAKIAKEISKNEPLADYILAVAYDCSATNMVEQTNEKGEKVKITFKSPEAEIEVMKKYIENLENAKNFYNIYLESIKNTNERDLIIKKMDEIKTVISDTKQKYSI